MTIFWHEMKRGKNSLLIWTTVICFMLGVCVLIYPEMAAEMDIVSDMFANMGSFSSAFGMDSLNFGEFMGYYAIECGNVLGMGGAFFTAILGASMLSKEEKQKTAEFLLTHPTSRSRIVFQKLLSLICQVLILNVASTLVSVLLAMLMGVNFKLGQMLLLHLAYLFMQIEIAAITFCISAFLVSGGAGIGLGLAVLFYFMNLISNLKENLHVLKYITPFGYTDGAGILRDGFAFRYFITGCIVTSVCVWISFEKYNRKDIA
jgi:ABC-2 type transport system permease protein